MRFLPKTQKKEEERRGDGGKKDKKAWCSLEEANVKLREKKGKRGIFI